MATLIAVPGAPNANSYPTLAEAQYYYEMRTTVAGWENADDQEVLLMMATRTLDAMTPAHTTYVATSSGGMAAHTITSPTWTGAPASATQKLAWPRVGMFDANGNSLDWGITSISAETPALVTTNRAHGRMTGDWVFIHGTNSDPVANGAYQVTVIDEYIFSIDLMVDVAGTTGCMTIIPADLKDAVSELAGALGTSDTTLDNDIIVGGITSLKAGSVSLSFKDMIEKHVLPDFIWAMMPSSWFTEEIIVYVNMAEFDVVSE